MKVVESIEVINFQSHAHTVIKPAGAGELTCIIGTTDSGKSALFRAIRWAYFGGPVMPRTGTTATSVTIHFTDGSTVTRERTRSVNRYTIVVPGEEPQVFEGFRNQVPYEVQKALGVRAIDISGVVLETNIARQLEPAFLGSAVSAPARAKVLGHIAGIEAVDVAVRSAGRDLLDGQVEKRRLDSEINKLQLEVDKYRYLDDLKMAIESAETLYSRALEYDKKRDKLIDIRDKLLDTADRWKQVDSVVRRTIGADPALKIIHQASGVKQSVDSLIQAKRRLNGLNDRATVLQNLIAKTVGHEDALRLIGKAESAITKRDRLVGLSSRLGRYGARASELKEIFARTAWSAEAGNIAKRAVVAADKLNRLWSIQDRSDRLDDGYIDAWARLEATKSAESVLQKADHVEQASSKLEQMVSVKKALSDLRQREHAVIGKAELAEAEIERCKEIEARVFKEIGHCPLCGSDISHTHMREAV